MANNHNLARSQTRRLNPRQDLPVRQPEPIDAGETPPWRLMLHVLHVQVGMVFSLREELIVGRCCTDLGKPDVDLQPYDADSMGVSRQHLAISAKHDHLIARDNQSANGSWLNDERMQVEQDYPIRNGDRLTLGALNLEIVFLSDPFSAW